jgi:hypothetical protein
MDKTNRKTGDQGMKNRGRAERSPSCDDIYRFNSRVHDSTYSSLVDTRLDNRRANSETVVRDPERLEVGTSPDGC